MTAAYTEALNAGETPVAYWRHPEIVAALAVETEAKCAYCEGVISDVAYPHVEHILPKSERPDLVVAWDNLTIACQVCNTAKGDYYDPGLELLHPYRDAIDEHVLFRGPAIVAALGSAHGRRTILRIKLMRPALIVERMKRIEAVHELLERWSAAEGADKELYAEEVRRAIGDDQEFAGCLRAYVATFGLEVAPE